MSISLNQGHQFYKMQGLQNHFVIIDARAFEYTPSVEQVRKICDPGIGVGAEQLVIIETSHDHAARVVLFNPDGSSAEACGNATRCVARLLMEDLCQSRLQLEIAGRVIDCVKQGSQFQIDMGQVSFDWQAIPLTEPVESFYDAYDHVHDSMAVNIGNPHVVLFVPNLDLVDKVTIGQQIQQYPTLPESANVGFVQVLDRETIRLQVYERPGILTLACGSGACAAVAAGIRKDILDNKVLVLMPGGELTIEYKQPLKATMTGPAEYCFTGYLPKEF